MIRWFINDLWRGQTTPWPMPPPPQLVYSNSSVSKNSFWDYTHPVVDRLSRTFTGDNISDFYRFQSNRASVIENAMMKPKKMTNTLNRDYQVFCCLGRGGFGEVFDGRRKSDNSPVIVKFLPKHRILNWGVFQGKRVPYEIEILWRLRGLPGIITIYDHFEETDRYVFIMEKIPNSCTLFNFVMECPPLANTELLRHIFREIIRINMSLQSYGVWHRDCKLENILYCRNDRTLRFIDFGSAAPARGGDFHEFQGTLEIMTPEWILERRYDGEQACVWTLGVCLYVLLFQQYPFRSKAEIVDSHLNLPFLSSPDKQAYQTMKQCLSKNGNRRPKLNSLLYLSWLQ
ncbi:unnamed protein product [Rotaria sp. Silwood1]|nr:unnamed protein product [Rotaria sp. Silwood1]CAF1599817.1 unnamed protein product [Rotaria sp. Silwood1]CAF1599912.1 unnamed protein product [Rotaria sp. Silwood1]CAF3697213.1 unnamed protein product [Rotaria sp. Silwood1]CAF3738695.1 unnamed protein product [Rotaria sp. Silwood1]